MVRLSVYQHLPNETVIDQFEAKEYDEFIIVRVNLDVNDVEHYQALEAVASSTNKKVIAIPDGLDVEFYGVKEDD